jgi:hypothetical protein
MNQQISKFASDATNLFAIAVDPGTIPIRDKLGLIRCVFPSSQSVSGRECLPWSAGMAAETP